MTYAETIRDELLKRRGDWPAICAKTALSYWWVTKFAQGRIGNPGVRNLDTLRQHFDAPPAPAEPKEVA